MKHSKELLVPILQSEHALPGLMVSKASSLGHRQRQRFNMLCSWEVGGSAILSWESSLPTSQSVSSGNNGVDLQYRTGLSEMLSQYIHYRHYVFEGYDVYQPDTVVYRFGEQKRRGEYCAVVCK